MKKRGSEFFTIPRGITETAQQNRPAVSSNALPSIDRAIR